MYGGGNRGIQRMLFKQSVEGSEIFSSDGTTENLASSQMLFEIGSCIESIVYR